MAKKAGSGRLGRETETSTEQKEPASQFDPEQKKRNPRSNKKKAKKRDPGTTIRVDNLHFRLFNIQNLTWNQVAKVITLIAFVTGIFIGALCALIYALHVAYPSGPPWQVVVSALAAALGVSAWGIIRDIFQARANRKDFISGETTRCEDKQSVPNSDSPK